MFKISLSPLLCAVLLAAIPAAVTAQAGSSLDEARAAVRKGTTPGIVLIPARKKDETVSAPQPSAAGASVPASTTATATTTAPATKPSFSERMSEIARTLPPPSGNSMQSAKRLDSDKQGIPLPTKAASAPGAR